LDPTQAFEAIQPRLKDPMNCDVPCFWGIIPGKTLLDEARSFFNHLGFIPFEGTDPDTGKYFYTISYDSNDVRGSFVTFYTTSGVVDNIIVNPEITQPKEGSPREWIAYSPETLIKRYGQPSRVDFYLAWPGGGGSEVIMDMYFDKSNLIVQINGENILPTSNHSPWLCPLTAPFNFVRVWLGANPPNPPLAAVPLEQATSLTMDQFTQMMIGDPQKACFTINGDVFP
jgi:hypothetical protein